jgi:D-alanyl-D-alanine dipeptidase
MPKQSDVQQSFETNDPEKIIFIADPSILEIPIQETHEEMVDIVSQQDILYGPSPEVNNNTDYTKMRLSVFEKLKAAQELLPEGLKFCLYEAYRSLDLQNQLFNERYHKVKKLHPSWSHEALFYETTRLVSPVVNLDGSVNIPPHSTGAAVDVYLVDGKNNEFVDMGLHPKDWMMDTEGVYSLTYSKVVSKIAMSNRALMTRVLEAVGFVNYPTEYWHWSYGDRYWAFHKKQPYALYGSVGS